MKERASHFEKAQRKLYATRAFRNPHFPKKGGGRRWLTLGLIVIVVAVVGTGIIALLTEPAFALQSVHVSGNETISTANVVAAANQDLQTPVLWFFRRSNRFLFSSKDLASKLQQTFSLAAVNVQADGTSVDIQVTERVSGLIWESGANYYLVDNTGIVIRPLLADEIAGLTQPDPPLQADGTLAPEARLKRLPVFIDVHAAPVAIGDAVLQPVEVTGALAFQQALLAQGIPFTGTDVDRLEGEWMAVQTLAGYQILFDPTQDVAGQAERLQTLLHDQLKDTKSLQYIDLRFGDHVYYK